MWLCAATGRVYRLDGKTFISGQGHIVLNVRDVSYRELKETYRAIRKRWQGRTIRGRTEREKRLLRVVTAQGGPPANRPCSQAFWEGVRGVMNRRYQCNYTTFHGPLMAYRNALKKVVELL